MEEEIFVDNRIIEEQILENYYKIMRNMKKEYKGNAITLKFTESRIMLEMLRFHPDFKKKWKKGYKFVYAAGINSNNRTYYDIFIKNLKGELDTFKKDKCIKGLEKLEDNFKVVTDPKQLRTTLEKFKKEFEEQVNIRKDFGICTKCFGYDKTNRKFVFCDCLLVRTDYNEFECSNPSERHTVISGKLLKSIYGTYEQGYEGEDPNDNQSIYDKYYITNEEITIPGKPIIKRGTILYQLNINKYIIVNDINSFRKNLKVRIQEANENEEIIQIPKGYRNLKKYDEK